MPKPFTVARQRVGVSPQKRAVRTVAKFQEWLDTAARGARFVYHVGHLAKDRGPEEARRPRINALAEAVAVAERKGLVTLVTSRAEGNVRGFNYIAIRRQPIFARPNSEEQAMTKRGQPGALA